MEMIDQLRELLSQKKSKEYYAEKLQISVERVEELKNEINGEHKKERARGELEIEDVATEKRIDNDKGTLESKTISDFDPANDDQIAIVHSVNLDKYYISDYKSRALPDGRFITSISCKLKKVDENLHLQKQILVEELKQYSRPSALVFNDDVKEDGSLLELSLPDLHIGKLAYKGETGEDYDLKIAVRRFKDAMKEIMSRVNISSIDRIVFPIGNDMINVDNEQLTTTGGTPQDCDSRFSKMVKVTKELLIDTIHQLSLIAPVDVVVVKGNHDSTISFLIGEILDAFFHNNPRVKIDNSPTWRKYYQYGKVGILYTHGDKEKHNSLGLIFATEQPKMWGDTKFRFAKLGHFHKSKTMQYVSVDTEQGFQVQILPSLSGTDEWHSSKGYLGLKQCKAFLYHRTKGELATYTYTV